MARATLQKEPILELVFDATDLHTGFQRQLLKAPAFNARFLPLLLQDLELPLKARAS